MAVHLQKVDPSESVSLNRFAFVRWYVDDEVSFEYAKEEERLVGWACKVILMGLKREIILKINALKMERDQERLSLNEGSSLQPLSQGKFYTSHIQKYRDRKTGLNLHPLKSIKNWRVN